MTEFGYAGSILKVDLTNSRVTVNPSSKYTDDFIGGRGLACKLYWENVKPQINAVHPDNYLICTNGPLTGFQGLASSRCCICGKTRLTEKDGYCYGSLGGKWGVLLKYAGYDGLIVTGKAKNPVYLIINNNLVEIKDGSKLWGLTVFETCDTLLSKMDKGGSVLTIGPAGENLINFSSIVSDDGAVCSGGLGIVMGSKNLKAIVVTGNKKPTAFDQHKLQALLKPIRKNTKIRVEEKLPWIIPDKNTKQICYKCGLGCDRRKYTGPGQKNYKYVCQAAVFYLSAAMNYYKDLSIAQQTQRQATRLCDTYGLDTTVLQPIIEFLVACFDNGLLNEDKTGLALSKIGSIDFIKDLILKISYQKKFGKILSKGVIKASGFLGREFEEIIKDCIATKGSETKDYDPRMIITTSLLYATEPRRPIQQLHEISRLLRLWLNGINNTEPSVTSDKFIQIGKLLWGSVSASDFSTFQGKAMAAKKIQDWSYFKECLIFCDRSWSDFTRPYVTDKTLVNNIFYSVTGKLLKDNDLDLIGERAFNLQRAILLQEGWNGINDDSILNYFHERPLKKGELPFNIECLVPGKEGKVISKTDAKLNRDDFEKLKNEYYNLRGWDTNTGLL